MAIEMWFREDMRNILTAINGASASTAMRGDGEAMTEYRRGYQDALVAVALACGLRPEQIGARPADREVVRR